MSFSPVAAPRVALVVSILAVACGSSAELDPDLNPNVVASGGAAAGGAGGGGDSDGGAGGAGGSGGQLTTDELVAQCGDLCDEQDAGGCSPIDNGLCRTICSLLPNAASTCQADAAAYQACQRAQPNACIVSPCADELDAFDDACNVFTSD